MQETTKNFNEKMTQLMKQFLATEKEDFLKLFEGEKEKAKNLMKKFIQSEELTVKENWELLLNKDLVKKQVYNYGFKIHEIYSLKNGSDYFIVFVEGNFKNDGVNGALESNNLDTEFDTFESFYDL